MGLHVGLIGSGAWSRVHLQALADSPRVERVTLAGRNEQTVAQRAAEFPIVRQTASIWQEVVENPSIDLVHVVVPHHLHVEISTAALSAGKHLICEKPAALLLAEFDRVEQLARQQKRRFFIVLNQVYNPLVETVHQLVGQGAIGRPFLAVENSYNRHIRDYQDRNTWRVRRATAGGGVLIDGGFHLVYKHLYFLASCGNPSWVSADSAQLAVSADGREISEIGEDYVSITVGYPQSLRICWNHAWTLPSNLARGRQCFLAGSDAALELTDDSERPLVLRNGDGNETSIDIPPGPTTGEETTRACLLDYLECIAEGKKPCRATAELARGALAVILGAYDSSRLQRRISLANAPEPQS